MKNLNFMHVRELNQLELKQLFGGTINPFDVYSVGELLWYLAKAAYVGGAENNPGANGYMGCKL